MKKLEEIFLSEAIACMSGYSKEIDNKLKNVKSFYDLSEVEKNTNNLSFENKRNDFLTKPESQINYSDIVQNIDFEKNRDIILEMYAMPGTMYSHPKLSINFKDTLLTAFDGMKHSSKIPNTTIFQKMYKLPGKVLSSLGINSSIVLSLIDTASKYALAVGIAYLVYKLWDRFLSSAARACNKLSGKEKSICMIMHRIKGAEIVIDQLNDSLSTCSNSENPGLCRYNIERQIRTWILKLTKYKIELGKLQNQVEKKISSKTNSSQTSTSKF